MQQTLLALAAILSFSYYALSRHSTDTEVERDAIATEIETAVTDAARARLLRTTGLAFDEKDVGRTGIRTVAVSTVLGPDAGEPGGTPAGTAAFDDVDDVNGWTETLSVPVGAGAVQVRVSGLAEFVPVNAPDADAVGYATLAKRITITAVEVPDGPLRNRTPATAALKRVVTPTSL